MKVVLLGTAWPYRGGLAAFNERLVSEFLDQGHDTEIYTFTLQYPQILFPGKTQYAQSPAPNKIKITRKVNAVNPINWVRVGKQIKELAPDILIIKYWMPFMAPCFGTIAKWAKKNKHTQVICIADNIIPHEPKFYDNFFTKYFIKHCDKFVVMSESVLKDLVQFNRSKLRATNPHPLFNNFGDAVSKQVACAHLKINPDKKYILFFGFIRDYKGLDVLLSSLDKIEDDIDLIIAGEYYADNKPYLDQIKHLKNPNRVHQFNHFINDEDVKYFFCAADIVVQPYKHATQSGVTQIAYHFNTPMLVTNVGGLPEMVPHDKVGYVTPCEPDAISSALNSFFKENKAAYFKANILEEKKRFGWDRMVNTIITLSKK